MLSLSVDPIIFSKMPIKRADSLVKHENDKKKEHTFRNSA